MTLRQVIKQKEKQHGIKLSQQDLINIRNLCLFSGSDDVVGIVNGYFEMKKIERGVTK